MVCLFRGHFASLKAFLLQNHFGTDKCVCLMGASPDALKLVNQDGLILWTALATRASSGIRRDIRVFPLSRKVRRTCPLPSQRSSARLACTSEQDPADMLHPTL